MPYRTTFSLDIRSTYLRYDRLTIVLHWLTVALVIVLWTMGMTVDFWPKGPMRTDYRSVHMLLGIVLGGVLIARLSWRLSSGLVLPADPRRLLAIAATAVHRALYVVMAVTIALGICSAWVGGDSVFDIFTIPSFAPGNRALASSILGWHELAANTILALAGLHAAAALLHQYLLRDDLLLRMVPLGRRAR